MVRTLRRNDPAFWDRVARYYEPVVRASGWVAAQRRLAGLAQGSVLDAACGTGVVTRALPASSAARVVALDRSEGMLREVLRRSRVPTCQADITALPFPDRAFDTVVCTGVLSLLPPQQRLAALSELARVGGGHLLLLEPFGDAAAPRHGRVLARMLDGRWGLTQADFAGAGLRPSVLWRTTFSAYAAIETRATSSSGSAGTPDSR